MVGGAKVADKIEVLKALATKVDTLIVGGGMAFTFLAALGQQRRELAARRPTSIDGLPGAAGLGHSRSSCPPTSAPSSRAGRSVARRASGPRGGIKVIEGDLPDGWTGLDIGPDVGRRLRRRGPPGRDGAVERPAGRLRGRALRRPARGWWPRPWPSATGFSVVGGGDSASALEELGLCDQVSFLSTGGGASLGFIERGGDLPALDALRHAPNAPR